MTTTSFFVVVVKTTFLGSHCKNSSDHQTLLIFGHVRFHVAFSFIFDMVILIFDDLM